jgi:hypothetical protein
MPKVNLLIETSHMMEAYHKAAEDIAWIGGKDFYIDIEDFFFAAKNTDYDNGYGSQEIAFDLVIVFKDGSWFSRTEYDGSEGWRYNECPRKPKTRFTRKVILSCRDNKDPQRDYYDYAHGSLAKMCNNS